MQYYKNIKKMKNLPNYLLVYLFILDYIDYHIERMILK